MYLTLSTHRRLALSLSICICIRTDLKWMWVCSVQDGSSKTKHIFSLNIHWHRTERHISIFLRVLVLLRSDLEGVEQQVTEETNEAQHGAFRDGLVDDEGEEDGVDPQQRDESQSGLC